MYETLAAILFLIEGCLLIAMSEPMKRYSKAWNLVRRWVGVIAAIFCWGVAAWILI